MQPEVTADEVRDMVRTAVRDTVADERKDRGPGETIERCLEYAARQLGTTYARAWALYYGRARQIPAEEFLNIQRRRAAQKQRRLDYLRAELARVEAEIAQEDQDMASASVAPDAPRLAEKSDPRSRR